MTTGSLRARHSGVWFGLVLAIASATAETPAHPACAGGAALTIDVHADATWRAGVPGRMSLTVAHQGEAAAQAVSIRLRRPGPMALVSASDGGWLDPETGDVAWNVGDLEPGQTRVVECDWTCEGRADVELRAEVMERGDVRGADARSVQVWRAAGGELAVTASPDVARVGDLLELHVVCRNRTPFDLPALVAWAESDGSVELRSIEAVGVPGSVREARPSRVEAAGVGSLGAGGEARWMIVARAVRPGDARVAVGVASENSIEVRDPDGHEVRVPVEPSFAYPRVRVVDAEEGDDDARLDVRVTPDRSVAPFGAGQVFVVEVRNTGTHPVDGALVRCTCSAERTLLRAEGWGSPRPQEGAVVFETAPPLAPGSMLRLVLVTRVAAFGLATVVATVDARRLRGPPIEVRVADRT